MSQSLLSSKVASMEFDLNEWLDHHADDYTEEYFDATQEEQG